MYEGIIVEYFSDWNELYKSGKAAPSGPFPDKYFENAGVVLKQDDPKTKEHGIVKNGYIHLLKNYNPLKVKAANSEQKIALELLRDDSIPLVTMFGAAGSGKTFLACAHMLHSLQKGNVSRIIIAKNLTPVGREIGFLPGDVNEKVTAWLGPFFDNFLKLGKTKYEIEDMVAKGLIEISPLTFIQGRSISNAILCVDEIQNVQNMDIVKQIITRAGEDCKILLLGDPSQRFEKGKIDLTKLIEKGKNSELVGHICFRKSVRSRLAEWAVNNL